MKIAKYRQPVRRLYVLGAGASHALSRVQPRKRSSSPRTTPLDADFLARLNQFTAGQNWKRRTLGQLVGQWLEESNFFDHGLEAAIVKRVSQADFLSAIHPKKLRGKMSNAAYVKALSHVICAFLQSCKSNGSGRTKQFINTVFPVGTDAMDYEDRIITFNYDTLIERPLLERGLSRKKIYFDRIAHQSTEGMRRNGDETFRHPLILKLHGSSNWRCDTGDFEKIITAAQVPKQRIVIWCDETQCPQPGAQVSPLIIPPIPNKPITASPIFSHLWRTAFEYLHEARELVIVGYSCPATDTLARTLFSHFDPTKLQKVTVVDPDGAALSKFRALLPGRVASKAKWTYSFDFNEYIDNGM